MGKCDDKVVLKSVHTATTDCIEESWETCPKMKVCCDYNSRHCEVYDLEHTCSR